MTEMPAGRIGRRRLLRTAGLAASGAITGFPVVWAQNIKNVTLRQFGTGVSNLNAIAEKVKQDLGFTLQMTALDTDAVTQKAVTQPEILRRRRHRVLHHQEGVPHRRAPADGHETDQSCSTRSCRSSPPGSSRRPRRSRRARRRSTVAFVDGKASTKFAPQPTEWATLIPTIYNADTLGIRPDLVGRPITSWKDLVDPAFKGKAAILNIPGIGIMDAAMVMESLGTMKYADKGNMTRAEIDKTIAFLIETKKSGQFRAFWKTFDESVNLMASGEVVIQSMWSPAVAAVRSKGIACTYQPLAEGYRAWARRDRHRQAPERHRTRCGV